MAFPAPTSLADGVVPTDTDDPEDGVIWPCALGIGSSCSAMPMAAASSMIAQLHTGCLASISSVGAPQRARSYGGGSAGGTAQRAPTGQRQPSPPLPPFRGRETAPHLSFEQTPLSTLPRSVGPAPAPGATASYTTDDEGHTRHLRHCTAAVACRPVALGAPDRREFEPRCRRTIRGKPGRSRTWSAAALPR